MENKNKEFIKKDFSWKIEKKLRSIFIIYLNYYDACWRIKSYS